MTPRIALSMVLAAAVGTALTACSGSSATDDPGPLNGGGGGGSSGSSESVDVDASVPSSGPTCPTTRAAQPGTAIVRSGAVVGTKSGETWAWKGIPYAAPPTGARRFRHPEPASCFAGNELQAAAFGAKCPQFSQDENKVVGSEDCLTLNVWAKEGATGAPVLVFIHGGGNTQGSASEPFYDGVELATRTGAVVVTLQYRLGALGFLSSTGLSAESSAGVSGSYGIHDQIAALRWVKENVAAFGGAPEKVLLFGESAGAQDTLVHVASPLSKGLFAAAIVESGGIYDETVAEGLRTSQTVVEAVGCATAPDVPACLRSKPAEEIAAVPTAASPLQKGVHFKPLVDGQLLPTGARAIFEAGSHNHVPIILGTNADETSRMVPNVQTDAEYVAAVKAQYPQPGLADAALAQYPSAAYPTPKKALIALTTDATWTCPIRRLSRAIADHQTEPVYRYHFRWRAPGVAGLAVGATHGLELPFVFRSFAALSAAGAFTPEPSDLALSEAIQGYWKRMASTGVPDGEGSIAWPRYVSATDPFLVLDRTITAEAGLATANCDFMDSLAP